MYRSLLCWAVIGLTALAAGCAMCAHPYDYCGPTFTGGDCTACSPLARAGSILSPLSPGMHQAVAPEPEMTSGEVISTTDEVLQETPPAEDQAAEPQPAQAGRWVARGSKTTQQK